MPRPNVRMKKKSALPLALVCISVFCGAAAADLAEDKEYLRDYAGWREAVLSYMKNGPGIFNVDPNYKSALNDHALRYVIERDGYPATKRDIDFAHLLSKSDDEKLVSSYVALLQNKRLGELRYSKRMIEEQLKEPDLEESKKEFLTDALKATNEYLERLKKKGG